MFNKHPLKIYKGLIKPYVVLETYNAFNKSPIDALLMFITRTVAFNTTRHFFSQPEVQRIAGG